MVQSRETFTDKIPEHLKTFHAKKFPLFSFSCRRSPFLRIVRYILYRRII